MSSDDRITAPDRIQMWLVSEAVASTWVWDQVPPRSTHEGLQGMQGEDVVTDLQCRKCGGPIQPGKVLEPLLGSSLPDFIGETRGVTLNAVGSRLADCMKCVECGHSFIPGAEVGR